MIQVRVKENLAGVRAKSPEIQKKVIFYISGQLLKYCDRYIPFDTGMMHDLGIAHSVPEQGWLIWKTPYARKQWQYGKPKNGRPLQGNRWAFRAWNSCRAVVLKNAQDIANGRKDI